LTYTDLILSNISYSYGKVSVFENATVNVPLKGLIQIKGINGRGKTTLVHLIIGLLMVCQH
jgi:ABC-type Mn2+/Zn2+ transport system ATPase subunit